MLNKTLYLLAITGLLLSNLCFGQDKLDRNTLISCKFNELVDGSSYFMFGLTESKAQVIQIFTERTSVADVGKIFIYDYIGESDAKIYRLFKSGKVILGVHKSKPAIFYVLDRNNPIVGYCDKVLH